MKEGRNQACISLLPSVPYTSAACIVPLGFSGAQAPTRSPAPGAPPPLLSPPTVYSGAEARFSTISCCSRPIRCPFLNPHQTPPAIKAIPIITSTTPPQIPAIAPLDSLDFVEPPESVSDEPPPAPAVPAPEESEALVVVTPPRAVAVADAREEGPAVVPRAGTNYFGLIYISCRFERR